MPPFFKKFDDEHSTKKKFVSVNLTLVVFSLVYFFTLVLKQC